MKSRYLVSAVVATSVLLTGCLEGSSDFSPDSATPQVRVLHAVSDAPDVNVAINGNVSVPEAGFRQAAILNPVIGTYSVSVDGILPGGTTTPVINSTDLTFEPGINYEIIASGTVADGVSPIVLEDSGDRNDATSARLRVVHLSPEAQAAAGGPVDVYLSLADDELPADPAFTFSFGEDVGPLEVSAGNYRVRITPENARHTIVYDSGSLSLAAGSDLLVGAIDNTLFGNVSQGSSPVNLLVVNGDQTTEVFSADTGANIRAVHNSSDAGAVDVYLNKEPASSTPDVSGLEFGETVPASATTGSYVSLDVGPNRVAITQSGSDTPVIDETPDLVSGQLLTILAAGEAGDGTIEALIFADDNRRIATEAKLRVIHGAIEAPVVDVYLIPTAETGTGDTAIGNAEPALNDFEYGATSGYVSVAEGEYVVFITDTDGNELFKSGSLSLDNGGVYTAVARLNNDTASAATVTLLDDFVSVAP